MAKDIFSKIIRNYNNELELILEKKAFDSNVKNLLLSMLYKIENGYADYKKVKVNVCSKNQFVEEILETIDTKCNKIEFIKPTSEEGKAIYEKGENCILDKQEGAIKCFQNEKSMLDAIMQMRQEKINLRPKYDIIDKPVKELLLVGNNMNSLELITDFNGWSWDITLSGKKNLTYNYLYQLIVILIGNGIIESWINKRQTDEFDGVPSNVILGSKYNDSFGITKEEVAGKEKDHIAQIRDTFKKKYGGILEKEFFDTLLKIAILETAKEDKEYEKKVYERIKQIDKKLENMNDNKMFIKDLTIEKKKITKQIESIDKLISNEKELKLEYEKKNKELPMDKKIFSVSHFRLMVSKERDRKLAEIQRINKCLEPKEFVKIKNDLEEKKNFYEDIRLKEKTKENLERLKLRLEETFIKCFDVKIDETEDNKQLEKLIYELRYYNLTPTMASKNKIDITSLEKKLIRKCCQRKILTSFSRQPSSDYLILKQIFTSKIIDLDTMTVVLKYSKGILSLVIFDGNTNDETKQIKLTEKMELNVKLNKKIKIWQ